MSRLSIEVTPEQHQRLKAIAALHGMSLKDYILDRALPPEPGQETTIEEEEALHELEALLQERQHAAQQGQVSNLHVRDVIEDELGNEDNS